MPVLRADGLPVMTITRRSFLELGLAGTAGVYIGTQRLHAADHNRGAVGQDPLAEFGLRPAGRITPVPSREIQASPLSVGFETLDRKHFDPKRTFPHLARLGVKWARCQTGWCRCEPQRGTFDFRWLDEVVDGLLGIGIQPWFNLGYGNKLHTPQADDEAAVGWAPVFDEEPRKAWLRFTTRLAEHFKGRVRHWEIWNEPNIKSFWQPEKPNPADYVRLVTITAPKIRKQIPDAVIIGGAFAGIPMSYIDGCLEAGLADHVDKISYHPYRAVPEKDYASQIKALRGRVAKHNPGVTLWQGENGCPSKGGPGSVGALSKLDWTEDRQAKWLLRRILIDLGLGIELTSYFHTIDLVGYRGKTNFKGLLRGEDYSPKPAYAAYQCLCALFDAQTGQIDGLEVELVGQRKVHLQVAWFTRKGRGLAAYWFPADLQTGWKARTIALRIKTPSSAVIDRPILIDPLTSKVYSLDKAKRAGGSLWLKQLPLLDYPLIIADARVVQAQVDRDSVLAWETVCNRASTVVEKRSLRMTSRPFRARS